MLNLRDDECRALLNVLWERSLTGWAPVDRDGRFLHVNPTYCKLLEYTEAELRAKRFQDVTDFDDIQPDVTEAQAVLAGEKAGYDMVKRYTTKTRKSAPVLLRVTGLWLNSRFIYFVAEIAALDKAPEPEPPARKPGKFWPLVKDYWTQILFALGAVAAVAREILDSKP